MTKKGANLITNPEGAIYHLHLKPEDICPVVITAGDPDRVTLISGFLDYLEKDISHREFHAAIGTLKSKRILILSTGIGPDNIDIVMTELHALFLEARSMGLLDVPQIKFIRLGTSGSIHTDYQLDSILIATGAVGLDNLPMFYQTNQNHFQEHQKDLPYYKVDAPGNLWKSFVGITPSATGTTLTCPGFYGPQFRKAHMKPVWDLGSINLRFEQNGIKLSNIEMETAAIYFFANELGHQAVSLSALIADRLTNRFSQDPDQTVQNMVAEAMAVVGRSG